MEPNHTLVLTKAVPSAMWSRALTLPACQTPRPFSTTLWLASIVPLMVCPTNCMDRMFPPIGSRAPTGFPQRPIPATTRRSGMVSLVQITRLRLSISVVLPRRVTTWPEVCPTRSLCCRQTIYPVPETFYTWICTRIRTCSTKATLALHFWVALDQICVSCGLPEERK